jgi:hypothetical protein
MRQTKLVVTDYTQWETVFGDLEQRKGLKAIFTFSGV